MAVLHKDETEKLVKQCLLNLAGPPDAACDARVLGDAVAAMREAKPQPAGREFAAGILGSPAARLAAAIAVVVLIVAFSIRFSTPVWALDQVVEAMKRQKACNLTLIDTTGVVFDMWARADSSGELSGDVTLKGSNGALIWVRDNRTYFYNPHSNVVEVDDAKTAGFSPWLGPDLMRLIDKADDARTLFGRDPGSGRDLVVKTGSMTTAIGRISFSFEFDRQTKLPVAYKQWNNSRRSGAPSISVVRIVYYETLPEGFLTVTLPADATYVQKPIVLPEENLALLEDPGHGIPAEGLSRAQASRMILEQVYKASMEGDLRAIRRLCPLTAAWSDALLRAVILNDEESKRLSEVVDIGAIIREGHNRIGPFVVVPVRLKRKDGTLWDDKQIVQFRSIGGRESCVVYGPYGMLSEVR